MRSEHHSGCVYLRYLDLHPPPNTTAALRRHLHPYLLLACPGWQRSLHGPTNLDYPDAMMASPHHLRLRPTVPLALPAAV
jgi:hypothetical protein